LIFFFAAEMSLGAEPVAVFCATADVVTINAPARMISGRRI
jgi:hypothetical protein